MRLQKPQIALIGLVLHVASGIPTFATDSDQFFPVSEGNRCGYISVHGQIVIPVQFRFCHEFHEGRAAVARPIGGDVSRYFYIDTSGKEITKPLFDGAKVFSEGLAPVGFATKKLEDVCMHCEWKMNWGYIDLSGQIVIKPQFSSASQFSEGLAAVRNAEHKWGFIDKSGKVVIDFQFQTESRFSNGLAVVPVGVYFRYIDRAGRFAIRAKYTSAQDFSEGLALVRIGGKPIVESEEARSVLGGRLAFIAPDGKVVIRLRSGSADGFSEGLAEFSVRKEDGNWQCGYINRAGRVVISPQFESCSRFSEGLARIRLNDSWGFVEKTGQVVFPAPFGMIGDFKRGLAAITDTGEDKALMHADSWKYGYIDKAGTVVWKPSK